MSEAIDSATGMFKKKKFKLSPPLIALLVAAALFILGSLIRPGFSNLGLNILRLAAFLGILASGQTLVIISGGEGIDLSIGAMSTLGAILCYGIINGSDGRMFLGLGVALGVGALIGAFNGIGIAYLRVPPLVMTMGMYGVVFGLIRAVTQGELTGKASPLMSKLIAKPLVFNIPGIVFIWLVLAILMWFVLQRTRYGKHLFAVGVNRVTSHLSGVRVKWIVVLTYMLCSMLAAFSGFIYLGYYEHVFLNTGVDPTMPAIAAVVMGGTLLSGGIGSYWGTMAGALVLQLITSFLTTVNIPEHMRSIVYGVLLLGLLAAYGRQKSLRQ